MQIQGVFKCPQCKGDFDRCKPSGVGRVWAFCVNCDLVVILEDYANWQKRMQKFAKNSTYGSRYASRITHDLEDCEKAKTNWKGRQKRKFNPTER